MNTQEVITLRIGSQTKANGQPKQIGTFRALTFDEIKAWAIPVSEPCTFCVSKSTVKGYLTFTVTTQEEADKKNAWREEHRQSEQQYVIGSTYEVQCGSCHGTCTRLVDTTPSHIWFLSTHNDARQAKVNGKVRTWKRTPDRIELPLKYGLYEYFTMDKFDIEAGRVLERIS